MSTVIISNPASCNKHTSLSITCTFCQSYWKISMEGLNLSFNSTLNKALKDAEFIINYNANKHAQQTIVEDEALMNNITSEY